MIPVVGSYGTAIPPPPPDTQSSSVSYWSGQTNTSQSGSSYNYTQGGYSQSVNQTSSVQQAPYHAQTQQVSGSQSTLGQQYSSGYGGSQGSQASGFYNQTQPSDSYGQQQGEGQYNQKGGNPHQSSTYGGSQGFSSKASESRPASYIRDVPLAQQDQEKFRQGGQQSGKGPNAGGYGQQQKRGGFTQGGSGYQRGGLAGPNSGYKQGEYNESKQTENNNNWSQYGNTGDKRPNEQGSTFNRGQRGGYDNRRGGFGDRGRGRGDHRESNNAGGNTWGSQSNDMSYGDRGRSNLRGQGSGFGGRGRGQVDRSGYENDTTGQSGHGYGSERGRGNFNRGRGQFSDRGRGGGRGAANSRQEFGQPEHGQGGFGRGRGDRGGYRGSTLRGGYSASREEHSQYSESSENQPMLEGLAGLKRKPGPSFNENQPVSPPKKKKEEDKIDVIPFIKAHIKEHCTGNEEMKKLAEESLKKMMQPAYCVLCNARMSGAPQATMHYQGKNHNKKIKNFITCGMQKYAEKVKEDESKTQEEIEKEKREEEERNRILDQKVAEVCIHLYYYILLTTRHCADCCPFIQLN